MIRAFTFRFVFSILAVFILVGQIFAENQYVNTRIDVRGSRYSDQVWVFAIPSCTRGFDNGWDAFKMLSPNSVLPQLFAQEEAGNFQIDAVPTLNNTYVAFKAGEDTVYTFTFNNEYLSNMYKELYLIDSVANKTINIFNTGTQYTFNVRPTATPVKRFKIVTSLPGVVVPPADTVVTPPKDTTVVVPPKDTTTTVPNDTIVKPTDPPADSVVTPDPDKKVKIVIRAQKKDLLIENKTKFLGVVCIYRAGSGVLVRVGCFKAKGTTKIPTFLLSGAYVVKARAGTEAASASVVLNSR